MIWAEAYDLPHLASPGKKIAYLPMLDYKFGAHADAFREEGSITLPTGYARLDELHLVDPDDHSNDVGSIIHFFQRGVLGGDNRPVPVSSFVVERRPDDLKSPATSTTQLSGRGLTAYFLDRLRLLPYDYPKNPSVQPEWNFGPPPGGGLLPDGDFEEGAYPNSSFEDGNVDQWGGTSEDDVTNNANVSALKDAGIARTGEWVMVVETLGISSGARRSYSNLIPGKQYTIVGYMKDPAGSNRFRAAVREVQTATHTNAYEDPTGSGTWWAEVGNVAQGTGNSDANWQQFTLTFIALTDSVEVLVLFEETSPFGLQFFMDDWTVSGVTAGVSGWSPVTYGRGTVMNLFEIASDQSFEGSNSLKFQGKEGPYISPFGAIQYGTLGAQAPAQLTPGKVYTASVRVRHDHGSNVDLILAIRRTTPLGGGYQNSPIGYIPGPGAFYIKSLRKVVSTDTWTEITFTFEADVFDVTMEIKVNTIRSTVDIDLVSTPNVWIDRATLYEGRPALTMGDLWLQMLEDRASWLVPTFDEDNDSANDPWDTVRSISLNDGDTYGQIAEAMQRLWKYVIRVRFDREDNLYYLDIFNPGYVHTNHATTTSGALIVGMNILGGDVITRSPEATYFRVKTDTNAWVESVDAALTSPWGEGDGLLTMPKGEQSDMQTALDTALERNRDQMVSFEFEMGTDRQVNPFENINIFDSVKVNLGSKSSIPSGDRIVTSVVCGGKPGQRPSYQIFVNSDAFASTGAAALAEAMRRLLRKLERPDIAIGGGGVAGGGRGGAPTIVVAASNSTELSKGSATLVCTGVNDHLTIQAALIYLELHGGRCVLCEGDFYITTDMIVLPTDVHLMGLGRYDNTVIRYSGNGVVVTVSDDCQVTDLTIQPAGGGVE